MVLSHKLIFVIILISDTSFIPYYDFKHLLKMKEYGLVTDVIIRFLMPLIKFLLNLNPLGRIFDFSTK